MKFEIIIIISTYCSFLYSQSMALKNVEFTLDEKESNIKSKIEQMGVRFIKKDTFVKNAYHVNVWEIYPATEDISQIDLSNASVENNGYRKPDSIYINWGQLTLLNGSVVSIKSHDMGYSFKSVNPQTLINQLFNAIQKIYGIYNKGLEINTYANYADGRININFLKSYGSEVDAYSKVLSLSTSNQMGNYSMYFTIEKNNWVEKAEENMREY